MVSPTAKLAIHLFGSFHVTLNGAPVTEFESNKVRALLAYLALEASRPHSREALIGLLWPEQDERAARRNLSQALFNLRQAICDDEVNCFLLVSRETIQFNPASDFWLDAAAFAQALDKVLVGEHAVPAETCLSALEQAEALYRGEFLAGFFVADSAPFSEWASLRRERYHRLALEAQISLANAYEQRREFERAIHYTRRQVELEPWREEAHQQLMRLLARSGQRSAALRQYEICRNLLAEELNIAPSEKTNRLYWRISLVPELGAHNLPRQATPFIGRKRELQELAQHLADPHCRLITLLGPGGIGKTRLAIEAAEQNRLVFLHGVRFVSLAALQTSQELVQAISEALPIRLQGDFPPQEQLLEALRSREMLLVLDNCEQLAADGMALLAEILRAAPEVSLLATSRQRLNIYGERVYPIGGLGVPTADEGLPDVGRYSAVELFLQSAGRDRAGFTLPESNLPGLVSICRLVEGMPLAIELAAAWAQALPCEQIAAEIERNLAFLSITAHGLPERHRSIQAAFDQSWQHLSAAQQAVFCKLSAFRHGFDVPAAAQVAGASIPLLVALADKSFIRAASPGRYTVHELLRQYAAEKLSQNPQEMQAARQSHTGYFSSFANDCFARFEAGQQRPALDALQTELPNLRAAWQSAIEDGQWGEIEQLMRGLYIFYQVHARSREGYDLFASAVAALETEREPLPVLGKLLWRQGYLFREFYTRDEAPKLEARLQKSVALLHGSGDLAEESNALGVLGLFLRRKGEANEARPCLEESVQLARQSGDLLCLAWALDNLGWAHAALDDAPCARGLFMESLALHRQHDHLYGITQNLNSLGSLAFRMGDYAAARDYFLESQAIFANLSDYSAGLLSNAGEACRALGDQDNAGRYLCAALRQWSAAASPARQPLHTLDGMARLYHSKGRWLRAYELAWFVANHPITEPPVQVDLRPLLDEIEARLPAATLAEARARVTARSLEDMVAEVLSENG